MSQDFSYMINPVCVRSSSDGEKESARAHRVCRRVASSLYRERPVLTVVALHDHKGFLTVHYFGRMSLELQEEFRDAWYELCEARENVGFNCLEVASND